MRALEPRPVMVTVCTVCGLLWSKHEVYLDYEVGDEVTVEVCIDLLKHQNDGPPGPPGPTGPMGMTR